MIAMRENFTTPLTRRTLTKGMAWSVPAVALAGAAPAIAASNCAPSPMSMAGIDPVTLGETGYNSQWMEYQVSYGSVTVFGLPTGVTVTSIKATWYAAYDDFRWLNNPTGTGNGGQIRLANGTWTAASGTTGTFTFWDSKNVGLGTNTLTYNQYGDYRHDGVSTAQGPTGSDSPHYYTSYTNTWTPTKDSRTASYTTASDGCTTFKLPELGEFSFREPRSTTLNNFDELYRDWFEYTVTLSDGTILHWAAWNTGSAPEYGSVGHIIY